MDFLGISFTDWIGYIAMATLFVSFMMKDIKKLRIINSIGGGFFVAYGVLLDMSWPIIIANSAIIGINVYYLFLKKN